MEVLSAFESTVTDLVQEGYTHRYISDYLQQSTGTSYGLSVRSVRRFCSLRGICYRSRLSQAEVDGVVAEQVRAVGHTYGRRTMHGLLRARGVFTSQRRVGCALRRVAPAHHQRRSVIAHQSINPPLYRADSFGEKIHLDQNEKLVMYGVTHVVAVDGYSRKIVGLINIPVKNAVTIYSNLFRPLLLHSDGIWEQVRVDHGGEFVLVTTAQMHLASLRQRQNRPAALRSMSRQNHRAERIWPEINSRVNYPIKRVLVDMEDAGEINMEDEITQFCVSWVTIRVIEQPIADFVLAWNNHRIPGPRGGIPNVLAQSGNVCTRLSSYQIPLADDIVTVHRRQGGSVTLASTFGMDPLATNPQAMRFRERQFGIQCASYQDIFEDVLHGSGQLFREAVFRFIFITCGMSDYDARTRLLRTPSPPGTPPLAP